MEYAVSRAVPESFLPRIFAWMFLGLLVTAATAGAIGSSDSMLTDVTANPLLLIVLFAVQIGIVVAISARADRMSPAAATGLILFYSATNGILFAFIFELYTSQSIFMTFAVTAAMFGAMAAWGYFTGADLSKLGAIAFMALIGLILATIVNIFVASDALYWITTYAGVAIFCALTAYDMQKLKQYGEAGATS
ncbi:MAG TPA: Bax inhibitor-1/YccA family protein, partial [Thermoleophilaceae bacterium]